jgi:hypothetical protein
MPKPPTVLTRYSGDYAIADLEQMRLSVSRITSFNDPFELHMSESDPLSRSGARHSLRHSNKSARFRSQLAAAYPGATSRQLKKIIHAQRGKLISKLVEGQDQLTKQHRSSPWAGMEKLARLICFTERKQDAPEEIPMWGYYADSHCGVRIHVARDFFEDENFSLLRINYEEHPPKLDLRLDVEGRAFNEFVRTVVGSKSYAWQHEKEWRLMVPAFRCFEALDSNGATRDFIKIKPEHLRRIDLGIRFNDQLVTRAIALKSLFPLLKIYRTTKHLNAYYPIYAEID